MKRIDKTKLLDTERVKEKLTKNHIVIFTYPYFSSQKQWCDFKWIEFIYFLSI